MRRRGGSPILLIVGVGIAAYLLLAKQSQAKPTKPGLPLPELSPHPDVNNPDAVLATAIGKAKADLATRTQGLGMIVDVEGASAELTGGVVTAYLLTLRATRLRQYPTLLPGPNPGGIQRHQYRYTREGQLSYLG